MSKTAISFYWRNDTPSFVTWRNRLATAPDTPTCIVIQGGQFTGGVRLPNQFVPEIVSPLPCSPACVRYTLLVVYFFNEFISFIVSFDKCRISVFNAFIKSCYLSYFRCTKGNPLTISDLTDESVSTESIIVVSLSFNGNIRENPVKNPIFRVRIPL